MRPIQLRFLLGGIQVVLVGPVSYLDSSIIPLPDARYYACGYMKDTFIYYQLQAQMFHLPAYSAKWHLYHVRQVIMGSGATHNGLQVLYTHSADGRTRMTRASQHWTLQRYFGRVCDLMQKVGLGGEMGC